MAKKNEEQCFRYVVKITTNGHPAERKFEGYKRELTHLKKLCNDFVTSEMFSPDGDFYFQRQLLITLENKQKNEDWAGAESLTLFDESLDLEHHLLNWEEETIFFPANSNTVTVRFGTDNFEILSANMLLYQVVGELKEEA